MLFQFGRPVIHNLKIIWILRIGNSLDFYCHYFVNKTCSLHVKVESREKTIALESNIIHVLCFITSNSPAITCFVCVCQSVCLSVCHRVCDGSIKRHGIR